MYSMYSHSKNDVVDCSSIIVCHGLTGIFIYTTFLHVAQREQIYIVDHASNTQQSHTVTYSHIQSHTVTTVTVTIAYYSHFSVSLQSPQDNYSRVCDAEKRQISDDAATAPNVVTCVFDSCTHRLNGWMNSLRSTVPEPRRR